MIGVGLLRHFSRGFSHAAVLSGTRAASGSEIINTLNFTPKACILFANDAAAANLNYSMGIDLFDITHKCVYIANNSAIQGQGTVISMWVQRDAGNWLTGYIINPTSVGFTIVWQISGACSIKWVALCLG